MKANFAPALDPAGRIAVDDRFRVAGTDNLYAIGGCAGIPPVKFGYIAVAPAALLARNIAAEAAGKSAKAYKAQTVMSLVPAGRRQGVAQLPLAVTTLGLLVNMKQKDMFIARPSGNPGVKR